VVVFRIREFSFFILIQNFERTLSAVFSGSSQDISALLDLMLVTVRFVGLHGNRARKKVEGNQSVRQNFHIKQRQYYINSSRKLVIMFSLEKSI
jgi:hypothetical protein